MNAVVTADTIEALKMEMDHAFEVFSDRHAESEAAEKKLQTAAQALSSLNVRRRNVGRTVESLAQSFIQSLMSDPSAKIDASKVTAAREEFSILDAAMAHLRIGGYADSERAHLVTIVGEMESQLVFEQARLAHHEGQVAMLLSQAVALDGSIELAKPGEVSTQLRELCADIRDKLTRARDAVHEFDQRLAADRARHESSRGESI